MSPPLRFHFRWPGAGRVERQGQHRVGAVRVHAPPSVAQPAPSPSVVLALWPSWVRDVASCPSRAGTSRTSEPVAAQSPSPSSCCGYSAGLVCTWYVDGPLLLTCDRDVSCGGNVRLAAVCCSVLLLVAVVVESASPLQASQREHLGAVRHLVLCNGEGYVARGDTTAHTHELAALYLAGYPCCPCSLPVDVRGVCVQLVAGLVRAWAMYVLLINASRQLHNKMLNCVVRSPILYVGTERRGVAL